MEKLLEEQGCDSLRNGPMGMDQVKFHLSGDPNGIEQFGKNEKRKLQGSQGTFLQVLQYSCAVTESLRSQRVEIREARHLDASPSFIPFTPVIVWGQNLDVDPERLQLFAEVEDEDPGGISLKSGK